MVSSFAIKKKQFYISYLFVHIYMDIHIWSVTELFEGNFIFKWVRTNLLAHEYRHFFYTIKWLQLLQSSSNILSNINNLFADSN